MGQTSCTRRCVSAESQKQAGTFSQKQRGQSRQKIELSRDAAVVKLAEPYDREDTGVVGWSNWRVRCRVNCERGAVS